MNLRNRLFAAICRSPDGGTAGAPAAAPPATTPAADAIPGWASELRDTVNVLGRGLAQLTQLAGQRQQAPAQEPPEPADLDDAALEALPRARFAEYIAEKTLRHAEKTIINPLKAQLQQVSASTTQAQIGAAIEQAKVEFPDFMKYKGEMVELAKAHPTLTPRQLYLLANPTGASKAGKTTTNDEGGDGKPSKPAKIRFGGLQPNTGGSGTGERNQKMAPADAVEAAWAETVTALGGEPSFEE